MPGSHKSPNVTQVKTVTSVSVMQRLALKWRRKGIKIGFVPTMGYLHDGHLSLVAEARKSVGRNGVVVVSIFVNPTQFAPHEDLSKYPKDFLRDAKLCRQAGVTVIFAPESQEMYPGTKDDAFSTYVVEEALSRTMEGSARPTHFRGVTTVVAKLFNIVLPDLAVFGAKDFQQASIVRRMVRDLNFPVELVIAPTKREPDGLAMSSRNKYLDAKQREEARILSRVLGMAKARVQGRKTITANKLRQEIIQAIAAVPSARLDYVEFFDPESLSPVVTVKAGIQLALAVYIGKTRLIDNATL